MGKRMRRWKAPVTCSGSSPASDRYISVRRNGLVVSTGATISGPVTEGRRARGTRRGRYGVESAKATNDELVTVWVGVAARAIVALAAAVELARRQAKRLAGPLEDLAVGAEQLGAGDPRPRHHRYGVPELDRVAEVLDHSAEEIGRLLGAERALAPTRRTSCAAR